MPPRPWLGYLFVGYYAEGDETKAVRIKQPIMPFLNFSQSGDSPDR
jgi:hypothetical protein